MPLKMVGRESTPFIHFSPLIIFPEKSTPFPGLNPENGLPGLLDFNDGADFLEFGFYSLGFLLAYIFLDRFR